MPRKREQAGDGATPARGRRGPGSESRPAAHGGRGRAAHAKRAALAEQVAGELVLLQDTLQTLVTRFAHTNGTRLDDVLRTIHGDATLGVQPRLPTVDQAEAMLAAIRDTDMKPKKGRAKDLVRVEKLVAALTRLAPEDVAL